MGDSRHKKPYPKGRRREVTDDWLRRVDDVLAANRENGQTPSTRAELMRAIDADKSSMTNLFGTKTKKRADTSKLVEPISELLKISPPTVETTDGTDELDTEIRKLSRADRVKLLRFLKDWRS